MVNQPQSLPPAAVLVELTLTVADQCAARGGKAIWASTSAHRDGTSGAEPGSPRSLARAHAREHDRRGTHPRMHGAMSQWKLHRHSILASRRHLNRLESTQPGHRDRRLITHFLHVAF
jgi:hypothetical protein